MNGYRDMWNGLFLCAGIGLAGIFLAAYIPIGAVAMAIIIGIVVGNTLHPGKPFSKGIRFSEKQILATAIALMGINLNFTILKKLGVTSIVLVVSGMALTLLFSLLLAKIFHFDRKFALLLGIGNGVCGSSAIAATEKIIDAREEEVGLSIAIVNFLGTLGIFLLPLLAGSILKLTNINTGVLVGNTLQAVGQVAAAGFSVSDLTGQTAIIIKMTRILMLFPLVMVLIFAVSRRDASRGTAIAPDAENHRRTRGGKPAVPGFILGFILFSLVPTFGLLPEQGIHLISRLSHYALIMAMAAIGLKITFGSVIRNGRKALLIGALIFVQQIIFSGSMVVLLF